MNCFVCCVILVAIVAVAIVAAAFAAWRARRQGALEVFSNWKRLNSQNQNILNNVGKFFAKGVNSKIEIWSGLPALVPAQVHYAEMWFNNLKSHISRTNSQLNAIHDNKCIWVTIQIEEAYPSLPYSDTMNFVNEAMEMLSINYGLWLAKLSGKFNFPEVLVDGKLPVKLYGLSLLKERLESIETRDPNLIYNQYEVTPTFPPSKFMFRHSWFHQPKYKTPQKFQTLLLSFTDAIKAAGVAGRDHIRLRITYHNEPFNRVTLRKRHSLFRHEIGHTFFMDDLYDCCKYPRFSGGPRCGPPPSVEECREWRGEGDGGSFTKCPDIKGFCQHELKAGQHSTMFQATEVTDMDHYMMRLAWRQISA